MALTSACNVLLATLGLATGVAAARLLGPAGRGELAAIQTWPTILGSLAMLGIPEALVYFTAREPRAAGRALGTALCLGLGLAVPAVVAGYALTPFVLSAQPSDVITAARWYLLIIPLFALVGLPFQPLRGLRHLVTWNVLRLLPPLAFLGVVLSAWIIGRKEAAWVAAGYLLVWVVTIVPVLAVVARRVSGPFWPDPRIRGLLLRYGVPSALSGIPQLLGTRLALIVLAAVAAPATLGLYAVAAAWGSATQPLLSGVSEVLLPTVAAGESPRSQLVAIQRGVRVALAAGAVLAPMLVLLTPWVFPRLFGQDFTAGVSAAIVLVVAGAVSGVTSVLEDGMRGIGRPAVAMWAELGGLAVLVAALVALVPIDHLMGAAVATLLAATVVAVTLIATATRLMELTVADLLGPTADDLATARDRVRVLARRLLAASRNG